MEYIVIFILSAAVFFFGAKYILIKRQLKSVSKQLEESEDRLISVEFVDDELEEIVVKINRMIAHIQSIRAEGEKSNEALKQSIADISHDMRTPLTSVIGYLQLAKKECGEEELKEKIDIALERALYCNRLINDFFEISVLDAKGLAPVLEKVDMTEMLCELILANVANFEEKGITPKFSGADSTVFAYVDRDMMTRVLQNLISNSIKYTSGNIVFAISVEDRVILTVSNPTEEKTIDTEHIFERFYRQDKSRSVSGSGLGLYLCRQLVEAMGGSIEAELVEGSLVIRVGLLSQLFENSSFRE